MTLSRLPTVLARPAIVYGLVVAFLAALGAWLAYDFWRERERAVADVSRVAMQQSQLISSLFGDTFLAADYVLRDVLGHLPQGPRDKASAAGLPRLLGEKLATVPGLADLVVLDRDCTFVAVGNRGYQQLVGTTSRQRFCSLAWHAPGQSLHIQYMPKDKSVNGRPVVLMSRVLASREGRMQAGAMAVMELDYAQQWIEAFTVGRGDVQTLLDIDGIVLARNPALPEGLGRRTPAPAGQPAFDQISGSSAFIALSPLDGRERVIGVTRMERFPFIAIVGYDQARALESWQLRARQFACVYLLLAVLSLALLRAYLQTVRQSRELYRMATTDVLTGLANRRQVIALGERETALALRYGRPLAVLMIDIDLFKEVNDRFGHPSGDRAIRNLAEVMRAVLRATDIPGRLGGEEFTAILPATDAAGAAALAERLRLGIEVSRAAHADDGQVIACTVSIGVAELLPGESDFDTLLLRADRALYQAKAAGRNRVMLG